MPNFELQRQESAMHCIEPLHCSDMACTHLFNLTACEATKHALQSQNMKVKLAMGRTLSLLQATMLLRASPALLHLLARRLLGLVQAQPSLPMQRLEALHSLHIVIHKPEARALAAAELKAT